MTKVVRIYDYAGLVSVELPYNLPPVISVMTLPGKTKQAPPKPEQVNGPLVKRLTPGLSFGLRACPPAASCRA